MPFQSTAQQRFMYARHPGIARRWTDEMRHGKKGSSTQKHPIKSAGLPNKVGKSRGTTARRLLPQDRTGAFVWGIGTGASADRAIRRVRQRRSNVGKAASSGTFERAGSTVVPMATSPVRRGRVVSDRGGTAIGRRWDNDVEKGLRTAVDRMADNHRKGAAIRALPKDQSAAAFRSARSAILSESAERTIDQSTGRQMAAGRRLGQSLGRFGKAFVPTSVLMRNGQAPSTQMKQAPGVAGGTMPTLAGINTGAPKMSAQSGQAQQASSKPPQIGTAATQTPTNQVKPQSGQKPVKPAPNQVGKADSDDRVREVTRYHGNRPRHYDPEARRQRRYGEAIAGSAISGGASSAAGAIRMRRRSRNLVVRERISGSRKTMVKPLRNSIVVDRRSAGYLGAGVAGLGAATALARRANDPRNRRYT